MQNRIQVSLERAIEISCAKAHPVNTQVVMLEESLNRVAAMEMLSPIKVPSFSRSKMDGFTLTEPDLFCLKAGKCLELQVVATIPAGWGEKVAFLPGQTTSIMTGAMIPSNTAAIVKQEDVEHKDDYIRLSGSPVPGQYIDLPGAEIDAGETIVKSGEKIDPEAIQRLASAGFTRINVHAIPRVYVINCGSELCLPGSTLQKGQIYHSNRNYMLAKAQAENCFGILGSSKVGDDLSLIYEEIEKGIEQADLLVISGGTAQGKYDLVAAALRHLGADFLFHGIESKPGRNISCSLLKGRLVFNLPGHPSAGGIMFDLLMVPVLRKLGGWADCHHRWLQLSLTEGIANKREIRSFRRGELVSDDLTLMARPIPNHEKNRGTIPLLLDLEPGQGKKGDIVKALLLK